MESLAVACDLADLVDARQRSIFGCTENMTNVAQVRGIWHAVLAA
jgi:hypothetical protein